MPTDTPHITAEQADLHVAAGLPAAERSTVDAHLHDCPECAAMIATATIADARFRSFLSGVRPSPTLEDGIVGRLRAARTMRLSPPARRAAVFAAAAAVVIGTGWVGSQFLAGGEWEKSNRARVASNLHQIGLAIPVRAGNAANGFANWDTGFHSDPFVGTQHDNIYGARAGEGLAHGPRGSLTDKSGASDNADSILLTTIDSETVAGKPPSTAPPPAAFRPTDASSSQSATNEGRDADRKGGKDGQGQTGGGSAKAPAVQSSDYYMGGHVVRTGVYATAGREVEPKSATMGAPDVPTTQPLVDTRKVIRTGTMAFDVDRFDTAADTLAKVVGEAGGFVGTVDSQKLPNGKTQGTITVRCPPERLDLLVLSLRSLGELKSQQIVAQDVTREYTDLESELAADRAMQDRLLDLIRTGKGAIKDLLAAENELGTWRVKIEKIEGQLRYMNAQVSLSTLAVTLAERDLRQAAATVETETADMGLEAEDVERARDGAVKAIDDAKGRIVEAELKRLDAGQLAARVVADVPPEMAGATLDRIKQLGRVARLEVHRQQTASDAGDTTSAAPLRTDRRPTRIVLSIYNLANVAPRRSTAVTLAADDPESAYGALLALANPGGRVVVSNLDRSANATGSVSLEVPPARMEAALAAIRGLGEVLKRTTTENADTQNTTDAKVGLTVSLVAMASVAPRETVQQTIVAADVPTAYRAVTAAAAVAHGHVRTAELNEQDRRNVTATVSVDVPRAGLADFDKAIAAAGDTTAKLSSRSADVQNTADSAVRLELSLASADAVAARETTTLAVEVTDADKAAGDAQAAAVGAGGRVLSADVNRSPGAAATAKVSVDVPLARAADLIRDLRQLGTVRGVDAGRDSAAPSGPLAHAHVEVTFATADALVADASGPWANVRHGLSVGLTGLLWSLQLIVVGLCLLVPWAVVGYGARRLWRRWYRPPQPRV